MEHSEAWRAANPGRNLKNILRSRCKRYGITLEEYERQLEAQDGACAICKRRPVPGARKQMLCIDHDHRTGKFRGLLCDACNRAIGMLQDSPTVLRVAAEYLERG